MKFFERFNSVLERYFVPIANKVASQRHVVAIKDGIIMTMPLTITGSIFLILGFLPIPGYKELLDQSGIGQYFSYIAGGCFGIIALVATLGVAYRLSNGYNMGELAISNAIITLASYFVTLSPTVVNGQLNMNYLGSGSLFTGVIIALISVEIIRKIVSKGIVISLPDSVPPAISKTFMALIPAVITITFWGVLSAIVVNTNFKNLHDAVNIIVGMPLRFVGTSLLGQLFAVFMIMVLWCAGIHGSTIVEGIMSPIWLENTLHNAALAEKGIENIVANGFILSTEPFKSLTFNIGGSGSTIGLVLLMFFMAKSKQMKEVGKVSITPSLFNINEPVIFGAPIVMNPILIVPFIINPLLITTITWFLMKWNIVRVPFAAVPWTTPPVISGFLSSGFSISVAILTIFSIILSMIVYYPFFKIYDKQLMEQEQSEDEEESLQSLLDDLN